MNIDDVTYSLFVVNALPQSKMREVERQLISDKEIDSTLQACITNYSANKDYASKIIGIDEEIIVQNDRTESTRNSIEVNDETLNSKITTMSSKISIEDLKGVETLIQKFQESNNAEQTIDENLAQFYLNQRPGTFPEDAYDIVKALRNGVETFNSNLQKALSEGGFDYKAQLETVASGLDNKQKYELYVNFLAALITLNVNNLSKEQMTEVENFQTIREKFTVTGDVTEDMLKEVELKIDEALINNTLCLGSTESLKGLIDHLTGTQEEIEEYVIGSEKDVREKLIASMAVYIAYQNGEIESFKGQTLSAEEVAVATAAGFEEMRVVNELNSGRIDADMAIYLLKFIGGVALFTFLSFLCIAVTACTAIFIYDFFIAAYGTSIIATIGAVLCSACTAFALAKGGMAASEKVMELSSRAFDLVVDTWRERTWPFLRNMIGSAIAWFRNLLEKNTLSAGTQQEESANIAPAT